MLPVPTLEDRVTALSEKRRRGRRRSPAVATPFGDQLTQAEHWKIRPRRNAGLTCDNLVNAGSTGDKKPGRHGGQAMQRKGCERQADHSYEDGLTWLSTTIVAGVVLFLLAFVAFNGLATATSFVEHRSEHMEKRR